MQRVNLRVGIRFKLGEEIYKIKRLLDNNYIETDNLSFPGTAIFATSDLLKWLNEGNLAFENYINKCTETSKHEINFSSTYNDISTEIKDKNLELAKFRLKVIEPLVGKSNRTEANVKKRVQEVNYYYENPALSKEKLGFEVKKRVSVTSVYEWLKAYEESNHDNCSLIPAYHRSGGKNKRRLPSIVLDFLQSIIENSGNNGEQLTNDQIQLLLIYKIQEHKEITGEEIPIPSYSSICRIINEVPEYKTMLKKKGNRFTKNKFNPIV